MNRTKDSPATASVDGPSPSRFFGVVYRWRWVNIAVAAIAFLIAKPISDRVAHDRSLTALFAADDPARGAVERFRNDFGDNPVVMLVYGEPDIPSSGAIKRNDELGERVASVPGVREVLSIAVLNRIVQRINGGSGSDRPALFRRNAISVGFWRMFSGYTHASDGEHVAVVAILDRNDPRIIERLRAIAIESEPSLGPIEVVGEPVLIGDTFDLIETDGDRMLRLTLMLLGAVLLITTLDLRVIVLAVSVLVWTLTMTRAVLYGLDIPLSLVSSVLASVVTIVAVTSVLHLAVEVARRRRRRGNHQSDRERSFLRSAATMAAPIFWTCATTAAGFASLGVSKILPVRQFGVMVAVGTILIPAALLLIAPGIFSMSDRWSLGRFIDRRTSGGSDRRVASIARTAAAASRRCWPVVTVVAVLITIAAASGVGRTRVDSNFLSNFRSDSSIAASYRVVENELGGAGVWDLVIDAPVRPDNAWMDDVRRLQDALRSIRTDGGAELTSVLSLADADAVALELSRFAHLLPPYNRLGSIREMLPAFYDTLVGEARNDGTRPFRIMLRSREGLETRDRRELIDAVASTIEEFNRDQPSTLDVRSAYPSGYYLLVTQLVDSILRDQWRCALVAAAVIFGLLVLATRRWTWSLMALAINVMPIVWVLGGIGWYDGKMNMGAAMIAAVSIGLSIDGSVHYLMHLNRLGSRRRGRHELSPAIAAGHIGTPILLATVALVAGFALLATSPFVPTATFGTLLSVTLILAGVANFVLLPAWVDRLRTSPRRTQRSGSKPVD